MNDSTANPILLFGAAGLLGRAIAASFGRGAGSSHGKLISLGRADCDITDSDQVQKTFEAHSPTIAINCAAIANVDVAERDPASAKAVNETAVAHLATACKTFGTRFVHISTDYVFDGLKRRPYQPADSTNPLSVYGKTKRAGEQQIELIAPPGWLIIRTSWIFGDTGPSFPRMILDRVTAGETCRIVDDQISCPTYAPDLVEAILELLATGVTGIRHVANSGPCSRFEQARAVVAEFGLPSDRVQPISSAEFFAGKTNHAARPMYSAMADDSLARPLRNWRNSLRDFRNAGILPAPESRKD